MAQTDISTPSSHSTPSQDTSLSGAVLASGGLDSAILLAETAKIHSSVYPLFVRSGLAWENDELRHLQRFLDAIHASSVEPLAILDVPVADLYGRHWSVTGCDVPDAQTPDEAVYLPGRNVLLLAKAMLWCHLHTVNELALGVLNSNPFPDATPEFFAAFENAVNTAVNGTVRIVRPYAALSKADVMRRGRELPLQWTFSCIRPIGGRHCGECNKCAERRRAFIAAEMLDPTIYATENPCTV